MIGQEKSLAGCGVVTTKRTLKTPPPEAGRPNRPKRLPVSTWNLCSAVMTVVVLDTRRTDMAGY